MVIINESTHTHKFSYYTKASAYIYKVERLHTESVLQLHIPIHCSMFKVATLQHLQIMENGVKLFSHIDFMNGKFVYAHIELLAHNFLFSLVFGARENSICLCLYACVYMGVFVPQSFVFGR